MQCTETISTSSVVGQGKIDIVPISHKLFHAKDTARKTVSNGSRVPCMKTWNPINNKKFETLSHLPPPSEESVAKQIDYMLTNGWIPCFEFGDVGYVPRSNSRIPGYYDGRYWTLWRLPMFGFTNSSQVLNEINRCKNAYLVLIFRCLAFDKKHQMKCMAFLVQKPPTDYSSI